MKIRICCLLVLAVMSSHAQEAVKPMPWIAKLNATQFFDITNFPTVQLSIERKINPKISLLVEGGLQLYDVRTKPDTIFNKSKGYKFNVELRAYILQILNSKRFTKPGGPFVGIQPYYRYNEETFSINYYKNQTAENEGRDERVDFTDDFGAKRKVYGINLTLGYQQFFKRFMIEPSLAIGSLYRKVSNTGLSFNYDTDNSTNIHDIGRIEYGRTSYGNGNYVNFTINFRIGYNF